MTDAVGPTGTGEAFVLPGSFGDEPQLAELRRALRDDVALHLVEIPGLSAANSVLADMVATARFVVDEIIRRRPVGAVSIVGYSFGASLALEAAAQLQARGRQIAFLGILDGPFGSDPLPGTEGGDRRQGYFKSLVRTAVVEYVGAIEPARQIAMATASKVKGGQQEAALGRAVTTHLRNKALRRWTPTSCDAPGLHVYTGVYGASNVRRWADLCPGLRQVEVLAAHEDLLKGTAFTRVLAELAAAMRVHRSTTDREWRS